jgi:hypothetical protein
MRTRALIAVLLLLAASRPAAAQKWKDIGTTSAGNVVSVDPKSIKRNGNLVSATVRVVFTPPVKASRGTWASSKSIATFDCTKRYLAAKENIYYADVKGTKVVERSVNKQPGFGPALGGSMGGIAVDHLCGPKPK